VTDRNPLLPHPTAAGAAPPARRPRARASRAVAALIGGTAAVALLAGPAAAEPTSPAAGLAQTASAKTASAKTASAKPALAKPDALKQVAQRSALVADIQRALNRLGYDAGPVDGVMGSRTRSAIRAYQQDETLLATGQPSAALRERLSEEVRERFGAGADDTGAGADTGAADTLVADTQQGLRRLGYSIPTISGTVTAETRAAIRAYQREQGLLVTGQPSATLLDHIRNELGDRAEAPPADGGLSSDQIAELQSELRRRGYDIPTVTGTLTSQTQAAIRAYQRDRGLAVTGEASAGLLNRLQQDRDDRPAGPTPQQIAAVQRALNDRGYEAGPTDGVLGPSTRTAIRTFQSDSGLEPTGRVSPRLLAALGIEAGAAEGEGEGEAPAEAEWRTVLADDFGDGDYTSNPSWEVALGQFRIADGGLTSTITRQQAQGLEDVGRALLGDVLQQQLGVTLPGQEAAAAAHVPVSIGNAFRIEAEVSGTADGAGRFNIGPYQGRDVGQGYRLDYRADQGLVLRLAGQSGAPALGSASVNLGDGNRHRILWERAPDGRMRVSVDGRQVIEVTDQVIERGFAGFSAINGGGTWTLHAVRIDTPVGG